MDLKNPSRSKDVPLSGGCAGPEGSRLSVLKVEAAQPFRYSVGEYGRRFFDALRERRFLGVRCPGCRKVFVPPRPVCGPCHRRMEEWIEVGPEGSIYSFTILRFSFLDPETGVKKPVPYGYGFIRLDGADTNFQHFLELPPDRKVSVGRRVRPVFAEVSVGNLRDIRHFELV